MRSAALCREPWRAGAARGPGPSSECFGVAERGRTTPGSRRPPCFPRRAPCAVSGAGSAGGTQQARVARMHLERRGRGTLRRAACAGGVTEAEPSGRARGQEGGRKTGVGAGFSRVGPPLLVPLGAPGSAASLPVHLPVPSAVSCCSPLPCPPRMCTEEYQGHVLVICCHVAKHPTLSYLKQQTFITSHIPRVRNPVWPSWAPLAWGLSCGYS